MEARLRRIAETLIMPDDTLANRHPDPTAAKPAREPLPELTLGRSGRPLDSVKPRQESSTGTDDEDNNWKRLAARCRAKADASRWAAERQRRIHERSGSIDEDAPNDPEMGKWAETLTDAFYWASTDDPSGTSDIALLDEVGGCFETVAEALLLVAETQHRRGAIERSIPLLAEAQSALRRSLQRLKAKEDPDQAEVYEIVRNTAARHHIFLKRFMRVDDMADPAGWAGLLARIESQTSNRTKSPRQTEIFAQLRSLCVPAEDRSDESWPSILGVLEELINDGIPPSSKEIRELLLPLIDTLPEVDDISPGPRLVLREIDRYVATRHAPVTHVATHEQTAAVQEAARLLAGRSIVLIGGLRHADAQRSLRLALGVKELVWIETKEHQSIAAFETIISRPEVAIVLLAIRWSSHAFGDVKQFCERHGKPLVRLPGGYNTNQVAAQIIAQCSRQLSGKLDA